MKVGNVVGLVGWRGMVGSVLMDRMQAENDFALIEPVFFSTSNAGGAAPGIPGQPCPGCSQCRAACRSHTIGRTPISGGQPLVYTATLADPSQWALVTASGGLRINPELHCEIAVDGEVLVSQQGGSGVTCSTRPW